LPTADLQLNHQIADDTIVLVSPFEYALSFSPNIAIIGARGMLELGIFWLFDTRIPH
jgi:hypothetical protein